MTTPASIRNIAFVGHPSSGKTTLIDTLAHITGASSRKGSVAEKTSICDTEPEEQDKQHTLQMAAVYASHADREWNLFDTPGYPDFMAETIGAMFAADLVVGVVSCSGPVTYNLRKKMETAGTLGRGRAIVLTHLDGENSDFDTTVAELRETIGEICVPYLLPDQSGAGFSAVRSVLEDKDSDWRRRLMDRVMDACENEELMMQYLETQELSDESLHEELPHAIAGGSLIPVLVCNPDSGVGVDAVLQFLREYAPGADSLAVEDADGNTIERDAGGGLLGSVFSVKSDPHVGKVSLVRIHRGTLNASDQVIGEGGDKGEKLGGLFRMVGQKREPIESAGPGEIVAFSKVENLGWGESFAAAGGDVVAITPPAIPSPTVAVATEPKSRADEQKIGEALQKLTAEDPTFRIEHTSDTHELLMHGMSDLHLQIVEARLKRRYGVEINTRLPSIAYKETITKPAEGHHRHKKQSGGRGQFGECYMRVRPRAEGEGFNFVDAVVGGAIPRNLIPAVEKGVREILTEGVQIHSEVVDVEVELYDGKFHAVDSDEASFKLAGGRGFKDAFMKAGPVLLEPVMSVEIHIPTSAAGSIFSDLTSQRRGQVLDQGNEAGGAITVIQAEVPLSSMLTYHRDLKSQTAGEGSYSMKLARYAQVPASEQGKILAELKKAAEED